MKASGASTSDAWLVKWKLRPDGAALETNSSWLLPVRDDSARLMLKLFKPQSDERSSAAVLRYFGGRGAVRLVDADADALLLERASLAPSLMEMATNGGDEESATILAEVVARLHAPRDERAPELTPLRDWFRTLFALQESRPILRLCASAARTLLDDSRGEVVLHGDLHHENVLHAKRGWLAIDPKGLMGESTYEIANLLRNPVDCDAIVLDEGRMKRLAALYAARLSLDPDRILGFAFAHAGLSASWEIEDGRNPAFSLACAELLAPLAARYAA